MPIIVSTILGNVSISPIDQTPTSKPSNNDDMVIDNEQTKLDEDKDKDKYVKSYLVSVMQNLPNINPPPPPLLVINQAPRHFQQLHYLKENDIVLVRITKITKIKHIVKSYH